MRANKYKSWLTYVGWLFILVGLISAATGIVLATTYTWSILLPFSVGAVTQGMVGFMFIAYDHTKPGDLFEQG